MSSSPVSYEPRPEDRPLEYADGRPTPTDAPTFDPDSPSVYVVVNGSLRMSPGKIASQTFQACQRLVIASETIEQKAALNAWQRSGTRTIVKIAETAEVFERVCREAQGIVLIDEGYTEIPPDSPTVFATHPILVEDRPPILKHKRIPLLTWDKYVKIGCEQEK